MEVFEEPKTQLMLTFSEGFRESYFSEIPTRLKESFEIMGKSMPAFKDKFIMHTQGEVIEKIQRLLEKMLTPFLPGIKKPHSFDLTQMGTFHKQEGWITSRAEIDLMFRILLSVMPRNLSQNDSMVMHTILMMMKGPFTHGWETGVQTSTSE